MASPAVIRGDQYGVITMGQVKESVGPFELFSLDTLPGSGAARESDAVDCSTFEALILFIDYEEDTSADGGRPVLQWRVEDGLGSYFDESALNAEVEPASTGFIGDADVLQVRFPARSFKMKYTIDVSDYRSIKFAVAEIGDIANPGDISIRYHYRNR